MVLNRLIGCSLLGACLLMTSSSALARTHKGSATTPTLVAAHHGSYAQQPTTKKKHFWKPW
jgi:hypothetical protein